MAKKQENTFLLVSLKEQEAKQLAQVLSNETSRKILDFLAEKKATETEISQALNIPISTVHYNIQALVKAKLLKADEFHYSEKGKEVLHYTLANKYVIIAPDKPTEGLKEKLMKLLPVVVIVGGIALALQYVRQIPSEFATAPAAKMMAVPAAQEAERTMVMEVMDETAPSLAAQAPAEISTSVAYAEPNIALWFLLGAIAALAIYGLTIYLWRKWRG